MKDPKKTVPKPTKPRASVNSGLSIPPPAKPALESRAKTKGSAKTDEAAEALKRLSKMTPEEQAAALFDSMLAAAGKKNW